MIVFTQTFLLSEAVTDTPLTHPRIGYVNYVRDRAASDVTVSSETTDGPKDSPMRPDTYEYWEASALPAWWKIDLGSLMSVDYGGIVGMLNGCAVEMETSADNVTWTTLAEEILPDADDPLMFIGDSVTARWVRFTFTGGTPPRIAVIYIGTVLAMERPIYGGHSPAPLSRQTELTAAMSRGGQFLGQSFRRHGVASQAAFNHLTADWYRENFDPFVKAARQFPYFFAWRPATFPTEVAYAWRTGDIKPSNMGKRDWMQVSWPINGIGHA